MKKLCLLTLVFVIILAPISAFSQSKSKITGTVSDSTKPLALVTVGIIKKDAKSPIQSTLTKENGEFELNKPAAGSYTIVISHTNYNSKQVNITVSADASDMRLDPIKLSEKNYTLGTVTVNGKRPLVEQSDDKVVLNVEDDPTNKTETAIDILRKTPFITVDGEDNIKVNGKSNFKVLLNGRETSMFARNIKEALRGFPGALISKIEVITNPSAKYDGEGIGGLINIITKKKIVGYNGTLSTFSRTVDKVNSISVNGNAKVGQVGLSVFFNKGFADPVLQHNSNVTIPTSQNVYSRRTLDGNQYNSSGWAFGNAELSWEVDSLNTISLYTNIDSWSNKNVSDQTITTNFTSSPSTVSNYHLDSKASNPGVNIGSDYIRHFKSNKEREFSLRFLAELGKADSKLNSYQDNPGLDRYLINNSNAVNNQFTIQADNSIPLKKNGKLEGGVKAILRRASSDFQSLVKYNKGDDYQLNNENSDYFKYKQDVVSVYGMYNLRVKKSSFRLGVRVEYTNVDGDFITSKTKVNNDYTTVLPNVQFTNRVSKVTTLVLSYTKRLQRPYIWDLNPFINNNDSLNISYGNPHLGPQTSHVFSTQLRFNKGNTFAGINAEASYSGNKILQYASFNPQTGITETTSLNIGKEFLSGLNLNFSTKVTPKWNLLLNGSFRYSKVTNNSDKSQSNDGIGGNLTMNNSYRFTDRFSISSFVGIWKEPQTIQTKFGATTWHNLAFNFKVFQNKINISVRAVNFLQKTQDFKTITTDKNFYNINVTTVRRRAAVLALTWNFGKLTENVSKKKGVSNDDLLTKPAAPTGN